MNNSALINDLLIPTNRKVKNVISGDIFRLYNDPNGSVFRLISDSDDNNGRIAGGSEVNGFYLVMNAGVTIKINGSKTIKLGPGEFYNLLDGEKITHKKYVGSKRFSKVS